MKRNHSSVEVRDFIIQHIEEHPKSISRIVSDKFGISRQSVNRYLHKLISDGVLQPEGRTRNRSYEIKPIIEKDFRFRITSGVEEDRVWRNDLSPWFKGINKNIVEICHYGFTEMFNNVIDHSQSDIALVGFEYTPTKIKLVVADKGIGIFNKIAKELDLEDTRHAVLELSKGKLTTDQSQHTGEGIFFTSRMFDVFNITSGQLYFSYLPGEEENWLLEDKEEIFKGTSVVMEIQTNSNRTTKEVFDKYTSTEGDFSFTKTHVPVALVRYAEENLVSRSQAKRLLARLEPFKEIFLNFEGVDFIGQAFADEIFRVFKNNNPDITVIWIGANSDVERMIKRVMSNSTNSS